MAAAVAAFGLIGVLATDATSAGTDLAQDESDYLRRNAASPIDWRPWSARVLKEARRRDRAVLLSIGYASCHWCGLMDKGTLADPQIAAIINESFLAVKVDRDTRPDLAAVYGRALEAFSGRSGWPVTMWLFPDGRAYYGGSFFAIEGGVHGGGVRFDTTLELLDRSFHEKAPGVDESAASLTEKTRAALGPPTPGELPNEDLFAEALEKIHAGYDPEYGGYSKRPKFVTEFPVRLLLRRHRRAGSETELDMVAATLSRMGAGGVWDHLGGGFHPASADPEWKRPYYSKTLSDNALSAIAYMEAWQATGDDRFREIARSIFEFLARDLGNGDGAYFSGLAAASPGPDGYSLSGAYYTWTYSELVATLGTAGAAQAAARYNVPVDGIANRRHALLPDTDAKAPQHAGGGALAEIDARLLAARASRTPPVRDENVITAWNGLALAALARAAYAFDDSELTARALGLAEYLREKHWRKRRLYRTVYDDRPGPPGFLDDHSHLLGGLIDLFLLTQDERWLGWAGDIATAMERRFSDANSGAFYFAPSGVTNPLVRPVLWQERDGIPSGNAVAARSLLRLGAATGEMRWHERGMDVLRAFAGRMEESPERMPAMLEALDIARAPPRLVLIRTRAAPADDRWFDALRGVYLADAIIVTSPPGRDWRRRARSMALPPESEVTEPGVYVCAGGACEGPLPDTTALIARIAANTTGPANPHFEKPTTGAPSRVPPERTAP